MLKIGLTGGIGSGKSTVRNFFEQLGIHVLDADLASRDLVKPGATGLIKLTEHLGKDYLLADGQLNRSKLRQAIFDSPELKAEVESILHPLIRERLLEQIAECLDTLVLIEIPLLVETQADYLDYVIVVDCSTESQIERTLTRKGFTKEQVISIIEQQASRAERLKIADWVIDSDQSLDQVRQQVTQITEELYALSGHS